MVSSDSSEPKPNDVFHATRLLFDPGSENARCAHPERSPSYVEELWSPSLERLRGKVQAKADAYCQRSFSRQALRVFLSQAGPQFDLAFFKLSITFWFRRRLIAFKNEKGDPVWVALVWLAMRLGI